MTGASATPIVMIDTCIVVYAHDRTAGQKHEISQRLLDDALDSGRLVLSVQILNEFYSTSTRPNRAPSLSHDEAHRVISDLASSCPILPLNPVATFRALDAMQQNCLAFWDALVWAVAAENGVAVVHTEDFQHGRVIDGVRFCNPFEAGI